MKNEVMKHKRLLGINPDGRFLEKLEKDLIRKCPECQFDKATSMDEARQRMLMLTYDLVISDMASLGDSSLRDIMRGRRFPILGVSNNGNSGTSRDQFGDVEFEGMASKEKPALLMERIERVLKHRFSLRLKRQFKKITKSPYIAMAKLTPRQVSKRHKSGSFLFY